MSLIRLLPENLINQIAAGEVVERPSSVVKELLENSIDANAGNISVEIKDGGKTFIKVSDDGNGMSEDDLELSYLRHATSKISDENDLWNIRSLGFRGEALASIASVSKMMIKSKRESDLSGITVFLEGGEKISKENVGMPKGTQIEVYNLFFNTPARQKYLKKESTEIGAISYQIISIALANPFISFKLTHNGKNLLDLPKTTDFITRITDIYGKSTRDALIPIFYGGKNPEIDGFIGKPLLSRSTTKHQFFFVNGRVIRHPVFANVIKQAYKTMLMEHKNPVFFINIKIDPAKIDANVHPGKIEIRFEDQQSILKIIYGAVKVALENADLRPNAFFEKSDALSGNFSGNMNGNLKENHFKKETRPSLGSSVVLKGAGGGAFSPREKGNLQDALEFSKNLLEREASGLSKDQADKYQAIAQLNNSYIVAKAADGLVLIDQHAAHERVRYEALMDQYENQKKEIQKLLIPFLIEFSADEKVFVLENMDVFAELGFSLEAFGGNTFNVPEVPAFLVGENLDEVIKGVFDDIENNKNPSKFQGKSEQIITYMSCRSAIKFGQALSVEEMQALISQLENLKRPYTCPHGRPTMIVLTMDELSKMFKRK